MRITSQKTTRVNSFLRVSFLDGFWTDSPTVKKRPDTPKDRATTDVAANLSGSSTDKKSGQIRSEESVHFSARLEEVIGEESQSAFARRCKVSEGTVRNCLNGAFPRTDNLVAFAEAGGVTVDWLATGREPKTRSGWGAAPKPQLHQAAQPLADYHVPLDIDRLRRALIMAEDAARLIPQRVTPERLADLVLTFYQRLGEPHEHKR